MRTKYYIKNNIETITDFLNGLDNSELVDIHNEYCQSANNSDGEIFSNDEDFFETFFNGKVLEAVRAVSYGEYNYSNDYVIFNGYGNLESFDNPSSHVSIEEIAEDILENPDNYYNIELEECFESAGGIWYEGTEEDAKDQFEDYKSEIEDNNSELEEGEEAEDILSFEDWAKENLTEI